MMIRGNYDVHLEATAGTGGFNGAADDDPRKLRPVRGLAHHSLLQWSRG